MRISKTLLTFVLLLLAFSAVILRQLFVNRNSETYKKIKISLSLYGISADRWLSLEQGIGQACDELGIEHPALLLSDPSEPDRQLALLRREIYGGADGLLVAVCDSGEEAELKNLSAQAPVVLLEAGRDTGLFSVTAEDEAIGIALAESLPPDGTVAVLAYGLQRRSAQLRCDAFMRICAETGREVIVLKSSDDNMPLQQFLPAALAKTRPDILVVPDSDTLELALELAHGTMAGIRLYGAGCSEKAVDALDRGDLDTLCFSNDYALGYLAAMTLASRLGIVKSPPESGIQYEIVTRDTLYIPETEHLLFPNIQ